MTKKEKNYNYFYQERSGNLIFLHKLCKKYLSFDKEQPIFCLKSTVLEKEELDFGSEES